jgi:FixJ family two-component response regulator
MSARTAAFVVAVVDDDQGILRSLACLLESADYAVRPFASGMELLQSGCLSEIDCLISDLDMPALDGFDLIRQVKALHPQVPAILITGYPDQLARIPPFAESRLRVFVKPFEGQTLLDAVAQAVRSAHPPT